MSTTLLKKPETSVSQAQLRRDDPLFALIDRAKARKPHPLSAHWERARDGSLVCQWDLEP
ncbi:hypothetical protein [Oxynema aestuarii]|uniref:Uncharacterized protein n=1 Tax=Oxynema aestuarii AP17 TaxID=2064643 RepID=A0A6H1U0S1_9CYAN|nr:hypothetical protein [Oxynema aestuarii]QIZ72468.1 hypothetical protein HCG48_19320 [Oxynema aestuarii AP17]